MLGSQSPVPATALALRVAPAPLPLLALLAATVVLPVAFLVACSARIRAQRLFVASTILLRPAALSLRFGFAASGVLLETAAAIHFWQRPISFAALRPYACEQQHRSSASLASIPVQRTLR
jgi:hypothetical protein